MVATACRHFYNDNYTLYIVDNEKAAKKNQNNSQDHLILKFSKKKGKRNSLGFWVRPGQAISSWNVFAGQI